MTLVKSKDGRVQWLRATYRNGSDWVWTSGHSCVASFCCLVGGVLRASSRFYLKEFLHLEEALRIVLVLGSPLNSPLVNEGVGHCACSRVHLWWVEHLVTELVVRLPDIARFYSVLIPGDLTVEVANNCLNGSSRSQRCSVCETLIIV